MAELVISNITKGINQRYPSFLLNNQTFEVLTNLLPYRASLLKKQAATIIGFLGATWVEPLGAWTGAITVTLSTLIPITLPSGYSIQPATVSIVVSGQAFPIVDNGHGGFTQNGTTIPGTINYSTSIVTGLTPAGTPNRAAITITFTTFAHLPALGIEPYDQEQDYNFPIQLYFDQKWCYLYNQSSAFVFNSYYKQALQPGTQIFLSGISQANPAVITTIVPHGLTGTIQIQITGLTAAGLGASWVQVNNGVFNATVTGANTLTIPIDTTAGTFTNPPTSGALKLLNIPGTIVQWSGNDYQQFQNETYSGAIFVTNGVPGWHILSISGINQASPAVVTTGSNHGVPVGNTVQIWINDLTSTAGASWATNVNQMTFLATSTGTTTFTIPIDTTGGGYSPTPTGGALQLLTASGTGDGIRWYDNQSTAPSNGRGFVNFMPPLDVNPNPRYLVGCDGVFSFKDHLMVWGTYERRLGDATPTYYPYRIAWSQLGNPFYALPTPVPSQYVDASPTAWQQFPGFGGNIPINNQESVISCTALEDLVLIECEASKRKLFYQQNEFDPFQIQGVNWEYGADTPHATIKLDQLILTMSQKGITATSGTETQRIDEDIPDQIYRLSNSSSGVQRVSAIRDYKNEFVYFCYPDIGDANTIFPTRIVAYNYYDKVFSILIENASTCGYFQRTLGYTWDTLPYSSWDEWYAPWDSSDSNEKYPFVSFGNPQGCIFYYSGGTQPDPIYYATACTISGSMAAITSPNHPFNVNECILFNSMPGLTIPANTVYQITGASANQFTIALGSNPITGTYIGGGTFARMDNFYFRTAQFNPFQPTGKGVRINATRLLMDKTDNGQFTLDIVTDFNAGASNSGATMPFSLQGRNISTSQSGNTIFQQANAEQIWQRLITSGSGMTVQLKGYMTADQMLQLPVCTSPFRLYTIAMAIDEGRSSS